MLTKIVAFLLTTLVTLSLSLTLSTPVEAKHLSKKSPTYSASMAKNKRSVSASFSNLGNVKTISYQLTYDSSKGPQGAGGSIKSTGRNVSRSITLGTCSKKVCTYHTGVKNTKLSVDFVLKSGGVVSYEKNL